MRPKDLVDHLTKSKKPDPVYTAKGDFTLVPARITGKLISPVAKYKNQISFVVHFRDASFEARKSMYVCTNCYTFGSGLRLDECFMCGSTALEDAITHAAKICSS